MHNPRQCFSFIYHLSVYHEFSDFRAFSLVHFSSWSPSKFNIHIGMKKKKTSYITICPKSSIKLQTYLRVLKNHHCTKLMYHSHPLDPKVGILFYYFSTCCPCHRVSSQFASLESIIGTKFIFVLLISSWFKFYFAYIGWHGIKVWYKKANVLRQNGVLR